MIIDYLDRIWISDPSMGIRMRIRMETKMNIINEDDDGGYKIRSESDPLSSLDLGNIE